MLQPFKQHSFKKLFNFSIYYTNRVLKYLKIFLAEGFWGDSPVSQAPGSHFKMPITQPKGKKIKMAQGHLKWDQNELIDEKTGCKKSRETVPLNFVWKNIKWSILLNSMVLSRLGEGEGYAKFLLKCHALCPICHTAFIVHKSRSYI